MPCVQVGRVAYTDTPQTILEKPLIYSLESELRFVTQEKHDAEKIIYKYIGSLQDIAYICNISYLDELAFVLELSKNSHE